MCRWTTESPTVTYPFRKTSLHSRKAAVSALVNKAVVPSTKATSDPCGGGAVWADSGQQGVRATGHLQPVTTPPVSLLCPGPLPSPPLFSLGALSRWATDTRQPPAAVIGLPQSLAPAASQLPTETLPWTQGQPGGHLVAHRGRPSLLVSGCAERTRVLSPRFLPAKVLRVPLTFNIK